MKRPSAPYGRWLTVSGSKVKKIRLRKGGQVDLVIQPGSKRRNPRNKRRTAKKKRRSSARARTKPNRKRASRKAPNKKRTTKKRRSRNPTDKQVSYALYLLGKAGHDTRYMSARFKDLGATMRERSGTVESWLKNMTGAEISRLIDRLK